MRALISAALLVFMLTACGGGGDDDDAAPDPTTPPPSSTTSDEPTASSAPAEPEGESTDCLLSATKFADRAGDHALDFATTAPAFGDILKLDNLDDLQSEIKVLCSDEVNQAVNKVMQPLTLANYEISLCRVNPAALGGCTLRGTDKVHRIGERASARVGDLRNLIQG